MREVIERLYVLCLQLLGRQNIDAHRYLDLQLGASFSRNDYLA
jgi:hypothetical protein